MYVAMSSGSVQANKSIKPLVTVVVDPLLPKWVLEPPEGITSPHHQNVESEEIFQAGPSAI